MIPSATGNGFDLRQLVKYVMPNGQREICEVSFCEFCKPSSGLKKHKQFAGLKVA
jgi:hypothetical protein